MKTFKIITLSLLLTLAFTNLKAQQTVGLFQNSEDSYDGYTLFPPTGSTSTYLINNCGEECYEWASEYQPGHAAYMLENGYLLRAGIVGNGTFGNAGGNGGIIEMINADSEVVWDYTVSSTEECQHHDMCYLPNGNILIIAWHSYTAAEAAAEGRTASGSTLWSDKIVEVEPDYENGGGTVVWEWNAWDHLIQDENPDANNYDIVADHPELINLNFVKSDDMDSDWLHINAVNYNADLDQILLSVHHFSEVWIIDHSTTTEEAASHEGGTYGKGGDLLYRWGNPQAYDQGTEDDQMLFLQHDAKWIEEGLTDAGKIMLFNNEAGTLDNISHSAINIFEAPVDEDGNYSYTGSAYGPEDFSWTYVSDPLTDFYGTNISGAQRLANGNTLICEGPSGTFFEVDYEGNTVWEYVNPVSTNGIIYQGNNASNNRVFRAERYDRDFTGFDGYDLTSQGYIESGSTFECDLFVVGIEEVAIETSTEVKIYPNPATNELNISSDEEIKSITIYNIQGAMIAELNPNSAFSNLNISNYQTGLYFVKILTENDEMVTMKLIKK